MGTGGVSGKRRVGWAVNERGSLVPYLKFSRAWDCRNSLSLPHFLLTVCGRNSVVLGINIIQCSLGLTLY